jgi:DNA-binding MarR family transcriptional regulator
VTEIDAPINPSGSPAAPSAPATQVASAPVRPVTPDGDPNASLAPGTELDDLEHSAWRAFLRTHARVARRLEADLVAAQDLPLAEFDVLFQLALAQNHRLRMNELADRVLLSRAGITRLVDRLVADGLVARIKCVSDARGAFAVLTEKGKQRLDEARPGHMAGVRRYFLDSFSRPELAAIAELLSRGTGSAD